MKLEAWLAATAMSKDAFASLVEASPEAVRLWARGDRIPNKRSMRRIVGVTKGQVQPNDFFDSEPV